MNKKSRLLALLLTLLMVVGMLPLAIFADEGGSTESAVTKPEITDLDAIKTELTNNGYDLNLYQSFDKWDDSTDSLVNDTTTVDGSQAADSKTTGSLWIKNVRRSYSVVDDGEGNKVLLMGSAEARDSDNDNYIDLQSGLSGTFSTQRGDGTHDLFVSVDLKMKGANVSEAFSNGGLFPVIYRINNGVPNYFWTVSMSADGGLYLGNTADPAKLIGFLSSEEYTRIAISFDRASNKYYVYLNGIVANPEGTALITDSAIKALNDAKQEGDTNTYTAQNFPIDCIRMYNVTSNISEDAHAGMYLDNFIIATRYGLKTTNMEKKTVFATTSFDGKTGSANAGNIPHTGVGLSGVVLDGAITYVKDGDDTVLQWHHKDADSTSDRDQAWMGFDFDAGKGANLRFSMDLKAGDEGIVNTQLVFFRSNVNGQNNEIDVSIVNNKDLKANGQIIGTVTNTKYHNLRIDVICNGSAGEVIVRYYFDGELKTTQPLKLPQYTVKSEYQPSHVRICAIYDNGVANIKENDIKIKSFSLSVIDDYNTSKTGTPFDKTPKNELVTNAGITRFYDADGKIKTENFTYNGETYSVGYNGIVLGKVSDGVDFTQYANYTGAAHESTPIKSSPIGNIFNGNKADGGFTASAGYVRDAFSRIAKVDGNDARIYTSYYNKSDHNSYVSWNIETPKDDTSTNDRVLDFDIMLGQVGKEGNTTTTQTFFQLIGFDSSGKTRKDSWFIKLNNDGWFTDGKSELVKISKTEFTRISLVIHPLTTGGGTFDFYANGVKLMSGKLNSAAVSVSELRMFQSTDQNISMYLKNMVIYAGTEPEHAVKLSNGNVATAKDLKTGFVEEDGVTRYYDPETGLPIVNSTFEVDGKSFKTNANGVVDSTDCKHVTSDSGKCPVCGQKSDGVSSLYGNSLVLGSDVQVVFYLDLATEGVKEVQVGFAREFTAGKQTKIAFSELETVDVDGKTYYKVPYAIAAKDVYTKVQLKVIKTGESGDTEGTTYSYSVEDYVNAVNAKPTDSTYTEKLKALCNALLVYGSNARAELTKDDSYKKTPGTVTWATTYDYEANYDTEEMIKLYKISLDLKSNIKIKIYFTYDTDATYDLDEYTITAGGKDVLYTKNGDVYCIEYEVAAKELDKGIEFVIKDEDDNGISFTISAVECARLENAKATEGSAMQYLMQSIKAYAEAAKDYTDAENNRID